MNDAIWVALIVAVPSTIGPLLVARATGRERRKDQEQDWARQDKVVEQAEEAAELLRKSNQEQAAAAAAVAAATQGQLQAIHVLVNSNLTGAIQDQLAAREGQLAVMLELVDLKRATGREPTSEALAAIESTQAVISELRTRLADRQRQTEVADEQIASIPPAAPGG